MDYKEFKNKTIKNCSKRKTKISNSWGVYDIYKHIRKNGWYDIGRPLKEQEFYSIVREINKLLAQNITQGDSVTFPHKMGKLELRKFEQGVSIVDGKLKNTYPINWEETLRLWYENEEARKNKILLRDENKYIYRVRYEKYDATYENKRFYQFTLNRFIRQALKENIEKGLIDTLW